MSTSDDPYIRLESPIGENATLLAGEREENQLNLFGCCKVPLSMFNVVALGLIFMLLFTAFAPSQNLQSTVNHGSKAGVYALGALYFTFSLANFIAPTIAFLLGERIAMMVGAVGYALFVTANILNHDASYFFPLFLMGGIANGLGAAILWTAQGSYITKNSTTDTMGRNNGIFFGLFQISQVAGNLIAAFVLPPKEKTTPESLKGPARKLFIIFSSIAAVAVVSFLILRPAPSNGLSSQKKRSTVLQRFVGIFKMFARVPFLLMVLAIVYSGLSQAFFAGNFTKLIGDSKRVGYVMACFGAVDALASVAVGRILDKVGRKVVLFSATFLVLVMTGIICLVSKEYFEKNIWICILCGILAGISDAGYNTLLTATTGVIFEEDPENAFGAFKFVQATTSAINYVLALDIYPAVLMLDIFLILGCASFFFLTFKVPRAQKKDDAINT
jgi:MFS family permease